MYPLLLPSSSLDSNRNHQQAEPAVRILAGETARGWGGCDGAIEASVVLELQVCDGDAWVGWGNRSTGRGRAGAFLGGV